MNAIFKEADAASPEGPTPAQAPTPIKIEHKIVGYSVSTLPKGDQLAPVAPSGFTTTDADRRIVLSQVSSPLANSLRWASRPYDPDGHASRTYRIDSPEGKFAVHVVHAENGSQSTGYPFEVWVSDGAPRGLKALCKSLSMDMRSLDRGWLLNKLQSLFTAPGISFDITLPSGLHAHVTGAVAAFARIVHARCEQLGAFTDEKLADTPVLAALMSRKEPKADGFGTLAWMVPIRAPQYEDDFELIIKEVQTPSGQVVPQSVWLSGRSYPSSLEGLVISLSFDLRVNDVHWSVLKLKQLIDMDEPKGEFWARIPGEEKQAVYPSIVSYMAHLILYRLRVLGLIDANLEPARKGTVIAFDTGCQSLAGSSQTAIEVRGKLCESCHHYAVRPMGGCDTCEACGASKC